MSKKLDTLGDRMKSQEAFSTSRYADKTLPIVARLDGRSFHTFCHGLERPYSLRFLLCMESTMCSLVEEFHCSVGYTQSDEITLVWAPLKSPTSEHPFGGRFQKLESILAAHASVVFMKNVQEYLEEKAHMNPTFDCRVWQPPSAEDAVNALLWRQRDAIKNAISMVAQANFSHKQLHGKSTNQMLDMLLVDKQISFEGKQYSNRFKRGIFAKRLKAERFLTADELALIPKEHRPSGPVMRSRVTYFDLHIDADEVGKRELVERLST